MPELTTFASRQPATFIRGEVFTEEVTDPSRMLALSGLADWDVRLRPLDSDARRLTETFEVVRTNPADGGVDRLGVAGERYHIAQNEEAFGLFSDLSPRWEAAGSFKNGAIVYGQAAVDSEIVIDPNGVRDVVKPFVTVITTHDGSGALTIARDALRLDCFNQFNMMLRGLTERVKIRHTLKMQERMKQVRLAWKQNNLYFDALSAEANELFQKSVTDNQFFAIVAEIMGERPEANAKGAQTKYDNSLELYSQAWKGETNARVYGTAWGALQALVERQQWARTIQNTASGQDNFAMAGMGLDGATLNFRHKAHALVSAL